MSLFQGDPALLGTRVKDAIFITSTSTQNDVGQQSKIEYTLQPQKHKQQRSWFNCGVTRGMKKEKIKIYSTSLVILWHELFRKLWYEIDDNSKFEVIIFHSNVSRKFNSELRFQSELVDVSKQKEHNF